MTQIYSYEKIRNDMRLLELLSQSVPNIGAACTEIINLEAILNLPKGTEHFLADIHGEYEAFQHILKNASGNIKRKVNEIFGTTMRESGNPATLFPDLLPRTKVAIHQELRNEPERFLQHHPSPTCKRMSVGLVQIHAFQGAQGAP